MAIPEHHLGLPEINFGDLEGAKTLWSHGTGGDWEYGTICWKGQRCWFTFLSYDDEDELIRYSVFLLTDEQARILDDWHVIHSLLSKQWQLLANDPATAASLALKEKGTQVQAFEATLPRYESGPIIAYFTASDYGLAGKPKKETKSN